MKYFPHLSLTLGQDIYVNHNGLIYLQQGSNMHHIGNTTSSTIAELRDAIEKLV